MTYFRQFAFSFLVFVCADAFAQSDTAASAADGAKQFDFLLGQWELDVHPKISSLAAMIHGTPKLTGTWKAWRAIDGRAIEDEMRIVDASGNPLTLDRSLRFFAAGDHIWRMIGLDLQHSRTHESVGHFGDGQMQVENHYDEDGKSILMRTHYFDISTDAFRLRQERSVDGGATWEDFSVSIDAKRISATATPD
ncbi:MAG: hypothetical protein ABJB01_02665 [Rudaea sp.]